MDELVTKETTVTSNRDLLDNSEHVNAFWKSVGVGDVAEVQKVLDGGWVEEIDCVVGGELKGDVGVDLEGRGHCDLVRFLLEKGAQVDFQDCYRKSALMLASECGKCEVVRLLLDRGAEVGLRDCVNGKSALMIASECGQCEVVKLLLDAGAQIDLQDKVGRTAIVLASKHEHWKVGMLLLERMAEVDSATLSAIMSAVMVKWKSLLGEYSFEEYLEPEFYFFEYINELIKSASLIECQEILWLACRCGKFKVCQAFVTKCRWVELTPLWGIALFLASTFGRCEIVALLLEKGFPQDLVHYGEYSALAMACACNGGHCEVVELLLGRGADIDAAIDESVLVSALNHEHTGALLERGAQVDLLDPEVPRLLLNRGTEVGLRDCVNGKSALMIASECGQCEVVKLLLDAGAQVDLQDKVGRTAIVLASEHEHWKVGVLLLERMGEVDSATLSAIMSAVMVKCKLLFKRYLHHLNHFFEYIEELIKRASLTECYQEILWRACRYGKFKICQAFVAKCRWVELTPLWGIALFLASTFGRCEIVALLLEKGFPQDLVHYGEYSALAMACACNGGHCEVVELLLGRGADVDAAIDGESVLVSALNHEHTEVGRLLLKRGAQVDFQDCYWDPEVPRLPLDRGAEVGLRDYVNGKSALMIASECGQCDVARLLLDRGAEVGLRDCVNGKSALMIASECGQCEVVKLLLDAGAQVDLQDKVGRTAIVLASEHEHWKVGVLLLERMGEVDSATLSAIMSAVMVKCKLLFKRYLHHLNHFFEYIEELIKRASLTECYQEILWRACRYGKFKICQAFVAKCRWVELTPLWGIALFLASTFGRCEIVALLLEKGFPQDLVHYGEYSALAMACACNGGHCEVVELLLGRGADVDAAIDGESVLVSALNHEHTEVGRLLLKRGAQVDFQDCYWDPEVPRLPLDRGAEVGLRDYVNGKSALMIASECGQCDVARLLLDRGAEVGLRDCVNGKSALMIASECGQCEVVKLLLDAGAQVDLQDKVGRTAIVLASEHDHWKVGVLLLERMGEVDSATLSAIMSAVMVKCKLLYKRYLHHLNHFFEYIEELIKRASLTECYQEILWRACRYGKFKICQAFVAKCRWVELTPLWGIALFLASTFGRCEIVALLLEKGFPQDLVHYGEYSALAMACACNGGHCEVVELLLGRGADVDAAIHGESVLVSALNHEHTEVGRLLLERGAQVDFQDCYWDPEVPRLPLDRGAEVGLRDYVNGKSALMIASECRQCDVARLLLDRGAEVGLRDCVNGKSALMIASECGQCEVVKLLLDAGAQVDLQDKVGRTAIVLASEHGHWEVGVLLLERMGGVDSATLSAIMSAVMVGCKLLLKQRYLYLHHYIDFFEYIEELIKRASLTECYQEILWLACRCGNFKICQAFVHAKCRWVELTPLWGRALFLACGDGHCEIVALLLEKGFPQDLVHYGEYSAASIVSACEGGHCEVVELLLEKGADVDAAIDFKHHSFNLLNEFDWLSIMPEDIPAMPELAMVTAARHGHTDLVRLLLEKGAQVDLQDSSGISPLMMFLCKTEPLPSNCPTLLCPSPLHLSYRSHFLDDSNPMPSDYISPLSSGVFLFPSVNKYLASLLLERSAQIDLQDRSGMSALMFASRHGLFDLAKVLLNKGAQIDLHDKSGRSAIMIASEFQHWDIGKLLIERGAEADATILSAFMSSLMIEHQDCWEPLNDFLNATQTGYLKDTNLLIEKGALIDTGNEKACNVLLWLACVGGDFYIALLILETSPWVERSKLWYGALYLACSHGHLEIVAILLEKGFPQDLVHYGECSAPAMVGACNEGHCEVVKLLLGKGVDVDAAIDDKSALVSAAGHGHTEVVRLLLERGAQVNLRDISGISPLMSFCKQFEVYKDDEDEDDPNCLPPLSICSVAELLLESGAQIDLQDKDGMSALMFAAKRGIFDMAKMLLEKGAQIDLQDKSGRSAIMIASEYQHWDVGKLLIERGAEVDTTILSAFMSSLMLKYQDCFEPLESMYIALNATQTSYLKDANLLIEKGALIDLGNEKACKVLLWLACVSGEFYIGQLILEENPWVEGSELWYGALYLACSHGHCEMVKLLLERGFPQDLVHYGECSAPAMVGACKGGHCEVVKLLLERGADVDATIDFEHHFFKLLWNFDGLSGTPKSALVFAASHGHTEVVRLLLGKGARVSLHLAVPLQFEVGSMKLLRYL